LEGHFPDEASALPETLAHHFAEGGSNEIAGNYLLKASRNALWVTAISEAISRLNRALELIGPLPNSDSRDLLALRLHASLGTALMLSKSWAAPDAEAAYSAANNLSHAAKDASEANWILWGIWVYHVVRGNMLEAAGIGERIRATADRNRDPDTHLIADMIGLQASFYTGRFEEAVGRCKLVERGFSPPPRHRSLLNLDTTDLEVVALVHDSIACWVLGKSDEAASLTLKAKQVARNVDLPYSMAWTLTWGSTPYLLAGDLKGLVARLDEGIAIASARGFPYIVASGNMMRGWVASQGGASSAGIAKMKDGLDAFRATGAGIVIPHFRTLLAEVLSKVGHWSEALEMLQVAEDRIERWQLAEVYRVRGDTLANANGFDANSAEQSYERGIAIAASQGAKAWQLRAQASLAE
jgi:predicted ATPase